MTLQVEDQLRSRWGEYMPQVFVLSSALFPLTTLKMFVVNHAHCPGVCLDKRSSSDLPALHGDLHHVWRGEDWQACRLQQVTMVAELVLVMMEVVMVVMSMVMVMMAMMEV